MLQFLPKMLPMIAGRRQIDHRYNRKSNDNGESGADQSGGQRILPGSHVSSSLP
jgi:hypothetical protein